MATSETTDISFTNFLALNFNDRFDRVAAHHQSNSAVSDAQGAIDVFNEVQTVPAMPEPFVEQQLSDGPRPKRLKLDFDDSDGEAASGSEGEAGFDLSALLNQAATAPKLKQADADKQEVKRRIRGKRAADGSDFPVRALVCKTEHARLRGIEEEKLAKTRRLNKAADAVAVRAFAQNPKLSTDAGEEVQSQEVEVENPLAPHISHDIRQMATHPYSYCDRCSHFALHGTHSQLKKPC